jgi:hypothetical protein
MLHLNIAHFDKCRKCCMFLTAFASVASCSQVSQMLFKAYCHNNDTKEALKTSHTLDLEEEK